MHKHFISIWFFIGLLLTVYGVLICGAGIYELFHPQEHPVQMAQYHAGIWWGALLLVLGLIYTIKFRPKKEQ
ncbi:MAG: hypothetical protein WBW41_09035 [Verrucomicrobiia bacterium]